MIARKLDSDYTITKRLIKATVTKIVREDKPSPRRSAQFVQHYTFGTGSGTGGMGGRGGRPIGGTNALMYGAGGVVDSPYESTRARIQGDQGVYLMDDVSNDSIHIVGCAFNDPTFWLGI